MVLYQQDRQEVGFVWWRCCLVAQVSFSSPTAFWNDWPQSGAIPLILDSLRTFRHDVGVLEQSLGALRNFAANFDQGKKIIAREGGAAIIIGLAWGSLFLCAFVCVRRVLCTPCVPSEDVSVFQPAL